jgi:hypothetical protein
MKSVFRCGTCERVTILDGDHSDAILVLCIPCNKKEKESIQPERSKREDLHHKDCIPFIKHNCWHSYDQRKDCEHKEDCDLVVGARMRCSEHCGNTVREVQ